ncbi:MAG: class I SAM-dependent methyltransferase [Cytophagaceae bacterium]|jgi:SAM-dependent methyltransferase|nr:class I SAM-dependent methyltransferase [Cytophagaceae bacterium]
MNLLLERILDKVKRIFKIKSYSREDFINSIPHGASVLEIGPFFKPVCRGANVKYFDILNQEELKERAIGIGSKELIEATPFIHFVSPIGDLGVIDEKFDVIISSHAIEHQLDLVNHLKSVGNLLENGGAYYVLVPDKRYSFDHFIAVSSIAEVLHYHFEKRKAHSLKSVIEHRALTTHDSPFRHWRNDHGSIQNLKDRIRNALKEYENANGKNIDVHAWYFTPDSFVEIIQLLNQLDFIELSVKEIIPTKYGSVEFFAVLTKSKSI